MRGRRNDSHVLHVPDPAQWTSLTALAKHFSASTLTVHRILRRLEDRGLAERSGKKHYTQWNWRLSVKGYTILTEGKAKRTQTATSRSRPEPEDYLLDALSTQWTQSSRLASFASSKAALAQMLKRLEARGLVEHMNANSTIWWRLTTKGAGHARARGVKAGRKPRSKPRQRQVRLAPIPHGSTVPPARQGGQSRGTTTGTMSWKTLVKILADRPRQYGEELAARMGENSRWIEGILRTLMSQGVVDMDSSGRWFVTPAGHKEIALTSEALTEDELKLLDMITLSFPTKGDEIPEWGWWSVDEMASWFRWSLADIENILATLGRADLIQHQEPGLWAATAKGDALVKKLVPR